MSRTLLHRVFLPGDLKLEWRRPGKALQTGISHAREFSDSSIHGPVIAFWDTELEVTGLYSPYEPEGQRLTCIAQSGVAFTLAEDHELTRWAERELEKKLAWKKKAEAQAEAAEAARQEAKAAARRAEAEGRAAELASQAAARARTCGKPVDGEGVCGRPPQHAGRCRPKPPRAAPPPAAEAAESAPAGGPTTSMADPPAVGAPSRRRRK